MPLLKVRRGTSGVLEVPDNIKFLGNVQMRYVSPWGKAFFVDGVSGLDTNDGTTPERAMKTIQVAVTAAGRGDVIYIRPQTYTLGTGFARYTEDVIVPLLTNDLSIIGVTNTISPEFGVRWKHVATPLTIYAPGVHLENIGFFCEGATKAIDLANDGNVSKVGSCGFTMYNCAIKGERIYITGGDGVRIQKTYFHAVYDGSVSGGITAVGSTYPVRRLTIEDCIFAGGNGTAAATQFITLTGATITEALIARCNFATVPQDAKYIVATTTTGQIIDCTFADADVHVTNDITLGGMTMENCMDASGTPVA